jgi:protein gp37
MRMAARLDAMGMPKYRMLTRRSGRRAVWTGKIRLDHKALAMPVRWRKPRRIFVNSMSDLFHDDVPIAFLTKVWSVMDKTPWHTYQVLTKRPDRMAEATASLPVLANVWVGTSVENADYLGQLDALRNVRAAVRFVSFEPLLGSVATADLTGIHWAIVGGESGPRARQWPRSGSMRSKRCVVRARRFSSSNGAACARRRPAASTAIRLSTRCRRVHPLPDCRVATCACHGLASRKKCGLSTHSVCLASSRSGVTSASPRTADI